MAASYGPAPGTPASACTDEMLTMLPPEAGRCATICLQTSCDVGPFSVAMLHAKCTQWRLRLKTCDRKKTARRSTEITLCHSSAVVSRKGFAKFTPALFTSPSMRPLIAT